MSENKEDIDDMEIAPGKDKNGNSLYTVGKWKSFFKDGTYKPNKFKEKYKKEAIKILETRIRERFLFAADTLILADEAKSVKTFGFAILAIDFMVIETIQAFKCGITIHQGNSKKLIKKFLLSTCILNEFKQNNGNHYSKESNINPEKIAESIYSAYRCGIMHSASTYDENINSNFRVLSTGPILDTESENNITINRTKFHEFVKCQFKKYTCELRHSCKDELIWKNFIIKMNAICGTNNNKNNGK